MRIFYESDNGVRFDSEEECMAYENRRKDFSYIIGWKSEDGNELFNFYEGIPETKETIYRSVEELSSALRDCGVLYIPNVDVLEIVKDIGDEYRIQSEHLTVGLNFWVDGMGWVKEDYYLNRLRKLKSSIRTFTENASFLAETEEGGN